MASPPPPSRARRAPRWLAHTLLWGAVFGVAIALGSYAREPQPPGMTATAMARALPRVPGPPPDVPALLALLGIGSVTWYAVVLSLPLMLWGARHVDAERLGRWRAIASSVGAVAAMMVLTAVVQYYVAYRGSPMRPRIAQYWPVALRQTVLPWIAVAGVVAAIEARRRTVRSIVEHERLRAEVAEQRLIALTGQLHPHFLFNTLQGISTLIHRDAEAADEMLAKLSDLLRDLLRHRDHGFVPLEDEMRSVRTYLEIARVRFADRLTFEIDIAPAVLGASVPLFILQPLVENALAHGIGGRTRGGRITVKAWRDGDRLHLDVADDGAGLPLGAPPRERIGLTNTRERLRASYGADQRLSLDAAPGGGVIARITIPYREHASPRSATP